MITSDIRNAYVVFDEMTVSVVASVTDTIVDGRPPVAGAAGRHTVPCGARL